MWKPTRRILIAFVIATLAGTGLHFLYTLFPNPLTALISPVNESLWEHIKILFWPYLVAALVVTKGGGKGVKAPWMASLLLLCLLMLGIGYVYYFKMQGESMAFGVGLYVLLMAAGFLLLPGLLWKLATWSWVDAIFLTTIIVAVAIPLFTFLPPNQVLFADLSSVNTFATIPC